jgi:predicted transposase YdaD
MLSGTGCSKSFNTAVIGLPQRFHLDATVEDHPDIFQGLGEERGRRRMDERGRQKAEGRRQRAEGRRSYQSPVSSSQSIKLSHCSLNSKLETLSLKTSKLAADR